MYTLSIISKFSKKLFLNTFIFKKPFFSSIFSPQLGHCGELRECDDFSFYI
jgi:hypothetical protein